MIDLIFYPNPILRKKSRELTLAEIKTGALEDGTNIQELIRKMRKNMYADNGIGLAAPQIGVNVRIFVITLSQDALEELAFINPVLSDFKGEVCAKEGCLSLPDVFPKVKRSEEVTIEAYDAYGKQFKQKTNGVAARVIQHEYDHCFGKLFIDYLTSIERANIRLPIKWLEERWDKKQKEMEQ